MTLHWIAGLWRQRWFEHLATAAGVALAVALLGVLGVFFQSSTASVTARAVATVSPDWQVLVADQGDPAAVAGIIKDSSPVTAMSTVSFADLKALSANLGDSQQTTGRAVAVGLEPDYAAKFPPQFRALQGASTGVLLAQQTAANLHAKPGDKITLQLLDGSTRDVTVAGIVDMPLADSFFQQVGDVAAAAPRAPPDNVLLLPAALWQDYFASQLANMPGTARQQIHAGLDHTRLPADPVAAFDASRQAANFTSAQLAGQGVIGNNLALRLDAARSDALYMRVLFLFLGLPGAIVAALFSATVIRSGLQHHLRDAALLKIRGYGPPRILALLAGNALTLAILGVGVGMIAAVAIANRAFGAAAVAGAQDWLIAVALLGLFAAIGLCVFPAWRALRKLNALSVMQGKYQLQARPLWRLSYLDIILVALGLLAFWQSASTGYQVVVAPEGVPTASVDYKAFLAPALLWVGAALLTARIWMAALRHGSGVIAMAARPIAGSLAGPVARVISHNRPATVRAVALLALAFSFAVSTAIFNTTYEQQAGVDAMLTNGASVTVTGTAGMPASAALTEISAAPGVVHAEPMMHRFAYVGSDLQDLYGINPATIGSATAMSDAYFGNGDARVTLAGLAATPDGVLVSDETVNDFQLKLGDPIKLRLQDAASHAYKEIPFRFVGIAREFPTAPRDSSLIANAAYVAKMTGNAGAETVLIKTNDDSAALAASLTQTLAARGLKVTDVTHAARMIGSTLTAVDLGALSRIQLLFAVPLAAGAIAVMHLLSVAERRRSFTILEALGATARQRAAFRWSEVILIFLFGSVAGTAIGVAMASMLVKLMTGVFDPPPDALAIPWPYLAALFAVSAIVTILAVILIGDGRRIDVPSGLKDLAS